MSQNYIDFKYVSTSGSISGVEFITQTEKAINELGLISITGSDGAKKLAQEAFAKSDNAQLTATDGLLTAQSASTNAKQAMQEANTAQTTAKTAISTADSANKAANKALDLALNLESQAGSINVRVANAQKTADRAEENADKAQSTADLAINTANIAFQISSGVVAYEVEEDIFDAGQYYSTSGKYFISNAESEGLPSNIIFPLYLSVSSSSKGLAATQHCWSQSNPSVMYARSGIVEAIEDGRVSWSLWAKLGGSSSTPTGLISLWSGSIEAIPFGWAICNGEMGTPDLRDRFVIGAGLENSVGEIGGAYATDTSLSGEHQHELLATDARTLTLNEMPSHNHNAVYSDAKDSSGSFTKKHSIYGGRAENTDSTVAGSSTGGSAPHTHTNSPTSLSGEHSHTFCTTPPYYALAYIMKL